jgi:hypothetical protein
VVAVAQVRQALLDERSQLPKLGTVHAGTAGSLPFVVVDEHGDEIEPFSVFLRDLMLTDMSPLTARSYGNDLLRWWRLLRVLEVAWDHATRADVEVLVGRMRSAANPQRHRRQPASAPAGSVNLRTRKISLRQGYAPATINHALSVLSSFYTFHGQFGRGPVTNPVPTSPSRRARLAHRSPIEPQAEHRRAPLRQKPPALLPRAIPDRLIDELFGAMRNYRDRRCWRCTCPAAREPASCSGCAAIRRVGRPASEYRPVTDAEWDEFEQHFDKRKVELGQGGRPYATPCEHEHACIRCPMLRIDPKMIDRLTRSTSTSSPAANTL